MPELPEVETVVRTLRPTITGRRVCDFRSLWPRQVSPSVRRVQSALVGRVVREVSRRGKYIVWRLDDGVLLVHLRMSGRMEWAPANAAPSPHVRAIWEFEPAAAGDRDESNLRRLWFCDARKFGRIRWISNLAELDAELGVEPLSDEFTPSYLAALLHARKRALKPLLLDQTLIAGLGNIYVDESLFRAGLHPLARADRVRAAGVQRLCRAVRAVLREAIRRNGTSIDWIYPDGGMQDHLRVYGRGDEPCRVCGAAIVRIVVGQRGTHFCPRCQVG
ncbi:MAG: DNA-formamidopyrimidine glycosylase [Phycisphaerales bacterium]|nr:DNA-formamidopyrimidine glycosylase [Phycisphaerales bacterium]